MEVKGREGFQLEEFISSMRLYRKSGNCPLYLVNGVISNFSNNSFSSVGNVHGDSKHQIKENCGMRCR